MMADIRAGNSKFFERRSVRGQDRELVAVPLAGSELYALLSSPKPPPIALENVSAFSNFALPLLAWLLALVTAWLAMDRLVLRWLDYLNRIAGLYASGKLSVQPLRARRQAPGEINVLADTMEEMAVRIRDRTSGLENAIAERDAAMKEIHHRVKNNLQIINSLLSLQGRKVKDPAAIAVLDDARSRINALSLIHRSLYEHNDIRSVEVKTFLSELVKQLDQALGAEDQKIRVDSDIDADTIDADVAVPLALFTAEAVTNSVKHAFPEGRGVLGGRVLVSYKVGETETVLTVEDDGIGGAEAEAAAATGIGGTLMSAFAKQLLGKLEESKLHGGGRYVRVRMPRTNGVTAAHPTRCQWHRQPRSRRSARLAFPAAPDLADLVLRIETTSLRVANAEVMPARHRHRRPLRCRRGADAPAAPLLHGHPSFVRQRHPTEGGGSPRRERSGVARAVEDEIAGPAPVHRGPGARISGTGRCSDVRPCARSSADWSSRSSRRCHR